MADSRSRSKVQEQFDLPEKPRRVKVRLYPDIFIGHDAGFVYLVVEDVHVYLSPDEVRTLRKVLKSE